MGLYLCIFSSPSDDDELDGVEVGSYDDFHRLRETVSAELEGGNWGSKLPVFMWHPDSNGEWSPSEAAALAAELEKIETAFRKLPPHPFKQGSWQHGVADMVGLAPDSLAECFIDVDGEPLLERLRILAELSADHQYPISFQ